MYETAYFIKTTDGAFPANEMENFPFSEFSIAASIGLFSRSVILA
jgi:hypothetical protein